MKSDWMIYTNAKNEKNATVLFNRFARQLGGDIDCFNGAPQGGAGYKIQWTMNHAVASWSELLLEVLRLAQNVGKGWLLTGDVTSQCSAWCNRPGIAGVQTIEWTIDKAGND